MANYRTSLLTVLISGVLEVRRAAFMWHDYLGPFGTLPKVTKLPTGEMTSRPSFYPELFEVIGIVTSESY